jgi:hypothetical protein
MQPGEGVSDLDLQRRRKQFCRGDEKHCHLTANFELSRASFNGAKWKAVVQITAAFKTIPDAVASLNNGGSPTADMTQKEKRDTASWEKLTS